jgi:hypothetical protein
MLRYILKVIKEYKIIQNLGYFIIDNTPNNNIIIKELSFTLYREFNLKYKPVYY